MSLQQQSDASPLPGSKITGRKLFWSHITADAVAVAECLSESTVASRRRMADEERGSEVTDAQLMADISARDKEVTALLTKKNKAQALRFVRINSAYIYYCILRSPHLIANLRAQRVLEVTTCRSEIARSKRRKHCSS